MWKQFHEFRSTTLIELWNGFFSEINVPVNRMLSQLVSFFFKWHCSSENQAESSSSRERRKLTKEEENVLPCASGCVPMKLMRRFASNAE